MTYKSTHLQFKLEFGTTGARFGVDTKLIVTYAVGDRTLSCARLFMDDLKERLANRVQITSDGHRAYVEAVEGAFGDDVRNRGR